MNPIIRLRRRVMLWFHDGRPEWTWWLDDHWPFERWLSLGDAVARPFCWLAGHDPIADNCGMPEHDSCAWCRVLTPGEAPRRERLT